MGIHPEEQSLNKQRVENTDTSRLEGRHHCAQTSQDTEEGTPGEKTATLRRQTQTLAKKQIYGDKGTIKQRDTERIGLDLRANLSGCEYEKKYFS